MIDIFHPQISHVSYGLEGKSFCIWGPNRTGKTSQCCRLPKPVVFRFEDGLGGIDGIPNFPIRDWKTYRELVEEFTDPANQEKAHEMYQTIIIDTMESLGYLCSDFICTKFGVKTLGESVKTADGRRDGRFNGYTELDLENRRWLRRLLLSGFTVVYIGHEGSRDLKDERGESYTKLYPRGDRRVVDSICDAVDIIGYARPNGVDENGREVHSSLFLVSTPNFLAGSRFDYLTPVLQDFTAENLTKAVEEAVRKDEETKGYKAVTPQERTEQLRKEDEIQTLPLEDLVSAIQAAAMEFYSEDTHGIDPRVTEIIEEHLGPGGKVNAATQKQYQQLELILYDLNKLKKSK